MSDIFLNSISDLIFEEERSRKSEDIEKTKKEADKRARAFKEQKKQMEQQLAVLSERNTELERTFERYKDSAKQSEN